MAANPLDRSRPMPLWMQLADDLRRRLEGGEFNHRLPTDFELVAEYGVSRHTAREAVRSLHDEGLIERHRGRGTFLRHTLFEQPLGTVYSLFRSVQAQGAVQRNVVLDLEVRHEPTVAVKLGLAPWTTLLYLARRRDADDEPLALERIWLPSRFAPALLTADFTSTSLYDELARRCSVVVDDVDERIQAIVPVPADRTALGLPGGVAALSIERLGKTLGEPVEWRHTIVRGDRYALVSNAASSPAPARLRTAPAG